jgi:hypothetical protein
MTQYQAYIIDSDDEFKNSVTLECADDEIALKRAKQLVGGHHVELWQYTRKIATLDCSPSAPMRQIEGLHEGRISGSS